VTGDTFSPGRPFDSLTARKALEGKISQKEKERKMGLDGASKQWKGCLLLMVVVWFTVFPQTVKAQSTVYTTDSDGLTIYDQNTVMDIDQTLSDDAQRCTIAFDGFAFITGNLEAQSFFPPRQGGRLLGIPVPARQHPERQWAQYQLPDQIAPSMSSLL
jgi:hypothetical protein